MDPVGSMTECAGQQNRFCNKEREYDFEGNDLPPQILPQFHRKTSGTRNDRAGDVL
jgi:hypothetical protein